LFFPEPLAPRHLHSFPTRRSSDLHLRRAITEVGSGVLGNDCELASVIDVRAIGYEVHSIRADEVILYVDTIARDICERRALAVRSEEHTSELQSRGHLVCRLLLEK